MRDFLGDLRYAGRALVRSPRFALLAILIMALGIGANTAVFSVVRAVLLEPLPYLGADRIVTVSTALLSSGGRNPLVSIANFGDWRDRSASFEAMATYRGGEAPVFAGSAAEYGRHANVDGPFFRVFGVEAIIGRTFLPEEHIPGNDRPVALISHAYWRTRFNSDPAILHRTVRIGNYTCAIVGVMPSGFHFPNNTDIWTPQATRDTSRTAHRYFAVGRLKPDVSLEQAQSELAGIAAGLEQAYPQSNKGRGVTAMRLQDELVGDVRQTLYLLWGVVGVVLLIACANTATLLLGKATARTREVAVRAALGASPSRIVRQLITESLLLALIAGHTGMLMAFWGTKALVTLAPFEVVRSAATGADAGVLLFTLGVSIATALLFGLAPALHGSKVDVNDALRRAASRSVAGGGLVRTHALLVVSEIALAVLLLIGAGLLMKSLFALHNVNLGYRPENVLVMRATGLGSLQENNLFFQQILSRFAALPGVLAVGAISNPPGDLTNSGNGSYFVDRIPETYDRATQPQALYTIVAPGTFAALGIPLKSGRDFTDGDSADGTPVAIVNEALVRRSFGGDNPIGRTIFCNFDRKDGMMIVGVVGDMRQRDPALEPIPDCYMPYQQHQYNNNRLYVVARTAGHPEALAPTLRRAAAEVSPSVPVSFRTLDGMVSASNEDRTFRAVLFLIFASLALCLALAGVYTVVAYSVEQQSREIAVRMSLGASREAVLRLILRQAAVLAAIGLTLGLAAAAAAARVLATVLFEVQPIDGGVYLAVTALLALVTLAAGYFPARRAAAIDPIQVLKAE